LDWTKLQKELWNMQKKLAEAAFDRKWKQVEFLQHKIEASWAARLSAVQKVAAKESAPGIDGVKWTTDVQKARAAQSLLTRDYHALPNMYMTIKKKAKIEFFCFQPTGTEPCRH
ncbi:MAG: reverse transcriptase N-terminal domain-containing protein, partial [Oscillospiraceae bacterium]|nr:reverse transcriptase N-terminal domain-containing protein [Oscillospiraceae bacterium]